MTRRVLLLAADANDALEYIQSRKPAGDVTVIWHGHQKQLVERGPFDRLLVTAAVHKDPRARTWIAACQTRVRGEDGRTPGERLVAGEP